MFVGFRGAWVSSVRVLGARVPSDAMEPEAVAKRGRKWIPPLHLVCAISACTTYRGDDLVSGLLRQPRSISQTAHANAELEVYHSTLDLCLQTDK